jgi:hypothetical protein
MPRRNRRQLKQRHNRGSHQRRRTTRGYRFMSKLKKYDPWYGRNSPGGVESDTLNCGTISAQS